jgi:ethanolamine utilization protein EutA
LVQALEMAAGRRKDDGTLGLLTTAGTAMTPPEEAVILSFSGGVADCIREEFPWDQFGDIGPILGQKIAESLLCREYYRLGEQTIRATVIGAGCHSAQLSGSTVFYRGVKFPLKNRPVVKLTDREQILAPGLLARKIAEKLSMLDTDGVLALPGFSGPDYASVKALAGSIVAGFGERPVLVAVEQDMAKALGQAIALCRPEGESILCIDRVRLKNGDYLDVGNPIGPALPVVVKTLILEQ